VDKELWAFLEKGYTDFVEPLLWLFLSLVSIAAELLDDSGVHAWGEGGETGFFVLQFLDVDLQDGFLLEKEVPLILFIGIF
jgi:hypothetical protein